MTWSCTTSSLHDFLLRGRGITFILLHLSDCLLLYTPRVLWSAVSEGQSCRNNWAALPQSRAAHVEGLFFCINCEGVLTFAHCLCAALIDWAYDWHETLSTFKTCPWEVEKRLVGVLASFYWFGNRSSKGVGSYGNQIAASLPAYFVIFIHFSLVIIRKPNDHENTEWAIFHSCSRWAGLWIISPH